MNSIKSLLTQLGFIPTKDHLPVESVRPLVFHRCDYTGVIDTSGRMWIKSGRETLEGQDFVPIDSSVVLQHLAQQSPGIA